MKRSVKLCLIISATLLLVPTLAAQTTQDEIAFTRAQIAADRQAIVAASLELSEAQGEAFWPMYREYRTEMDDQADRSWKLLMEFADKYESLSDADAETLLKDWISIEKKQISIRDTWIKKFSKTIGAATTARFVQIENKLDAMIKLEAAASVPLAKPAN